MLRADMADEGLHVAHRARRSWTESRGPGRAAVTARIPCEEVEVGQIELVDEVRHPRRVLVAAMEQHDRAASRWRGAGQ